MFGLGVTECTFLVSRVVLILLSDYFCTRTNKHGLIHALTSMDNYHTLSTSDHKGPSQAANLVRLGLERQLLTAAVQISEDLPTLIEHGLSQQMSLPLT